MSVRRTVAALVGAVLLLAGCAGDPEPRFTPTQSPSPTESETSAEPEAQTPEEFIREWFRVGTAMQNTGDTATFRSMSDDCEPCETFADDIEAVYDAGGYISIESERVLDVKQMESGDYVVNVRSTPTKFRESSDAQVDSFPGGVNTYQVTLTGRNGSWLLADYLDRS